MQLKVLRWKRFKCVKCYQEGSSGKSEAEYRGDKNNCGLCEVFAVVRYVVRRTVEGLEHGYR